MGTGRLSGEPRQVGATWGSSWTWGCIQAWEFIGMAQGRGSAQELGMCRWSVGHMLDGKGCITVVTYNVT